ncbi:MAG: hypothetical protein R2850_00055 [Bacteroidia bacterium]
MSDDQVELSKLEFKSALSNQDTIPYLLSESEILTDPEWSYNDDESDFLLFL